MSGDARREPIESRHVAGAENGTGPAVPPVMQRRLDALEEGRPPTTVLGKALYEQLSMLAMLIMGTGDIYCANTLAANAARLATAWDNLAKKNAQVRAWLEMLTSGGQWTEAVMATLAVALPMAQHHGIYPRNWPNPFGLGLVPPSDEVTEHEQQNPSAPPPGPAAGWPETGPPADDFFPPQPWQPDEAADDKPDDAGTAAAD